jgi:hypothetical protein
MLSHNNVDNLQAQADHDHDYARTIYEGVGLAFYFWRGLVGFWGSRNGLL